MKERQRIITVIIVVAIYNLVDQFFFRKHKGIDDISVMVSIGIALVLYILLIYFFGKKHQN